MQPGGGGKSLTDSHPRLECMCSRLTKKSASCRLPSRVMSSPGKTGKRVRPCKTEQNHCDVRRRVSPTHRRSRGTGRLPPPGTTAARTHTSRRPPRSRCTPTLRRRGGGGGEWRPEFLIRSIQSRTVFYHLPVKWQLRLPIVAGRAIASWSYLLPAERDEGRYNADASSQKKKQRARDVHIPSSIVLVDPNHCRTTLTPSSVIIFGYLLRNATPSN